MDPVDRQEAIDIVAFECGEWQGLAKEINEQIQRLPSVEPAHKTGDWIINSNTKPYYAVWWYECSECGQRPLRDVYGQEVLSDYCPNCGCKMVGGEA